MRILHLSPSRPHILPAAGTEMPPVLEKYAESTQLWKLATYVRPGTERIVILRRDPHGTALSLTLTSETM